jgi:hypothetical protein
MKHIRLAQFLASLVLGSLALQAQSPTNSTQGPAVPRPEDLPPVAPDSNASTTPATTAAPPTVRGVSPIARPANTGTVLPGRDGQPPPPKPGAERTTGDEDEMDDLDIQRRTAPDDLGTTPLPSPGAPLGSASTQPASADPLVVVGPIARSATAAKAPPKAGVARTTGDEDEMDDLDIQRRTAPSDLGDAPLPAFDAPLAGRTAPVLPGRGVMPDLPVDRLVPATRSVASAATQPDAPKGVGAAAGPSLRMSKPVFSTSELIIVEFAGVPGNVHDWVCIVPADAPDDTNGSDWNYLKGETSGQYRFSRLLPPGRYEVRLFADWPRGGHHVIARVAFEVK